MKTDSKKLKNNISSYMLVAVIGLIAGLITRLSDFFPNNDLCAFSSIATLFGVWILTTTLVIYFSSSNINAAINAFVYLFAMSFSFYFFKYILGLFLPQFDNGNFQWNLFMIYALGSLACGVVGFALYFWNKGGKVGSFLYALPIGALLAETIGVAIYLYHNHIYLFQLIFNALSVIILGFWFFRKANHKVIYITTIVVVALTGYFFFYHLFL